MHFVPGNSGGHTGGASGAVHQGPRPFLGPTSEDQIAIFFEKLTLSYSRLCTLWTSWRLPFSVCHPSLCQHNPVPMTSFIKAQRHLLLRTLMTSLIASRHSCCHSVHCLRTITRSSISYRRGTARYVDRRVN